MGRWYCVPAYYVAVVPGYKFGIPFDYMRRLKRNARETPARVNDVACGGGGVVMRAKSRCAARSGYR
jgi:predicted Rossmann-fold nucleotide-binding protein